jgi:hypothetical protein
MKKQEGEIELRIAAALSKVALVLSNLPGGT